MGPKRDIDDIDLDKMFNILERGFDKMEHGFATLDVEKIRDHIDSVLSDSRSRVDTRIRRVQERVQDRLDNRREDYGYEDDGFIERKSQAMRSVVKMVIIISVIFIVLIMGAMTFSLINKKSTDIPQISPPSIEQPVQPGELKKL